MKHDSSRILSLRRFRSGSQTTLVQEISDDVLGFSYKGWHPSVKLLFWAGLAGTDAVMIGDWGLGLERPCQNKGIRLLFLDRTLEDCS